MGKAVEFCIQARSEIILHRYLCYQVKIEFKKKKMKEKGMLSFVKGGSPSRTIVLLYILKAKVLGIYKQPTG